MASAKAKQVKVDALQRQLDNLKKRIAKANGRIAEETAQRDALLEDQKRLKSRLDWQKREPVDGEDSSAPEDEGGEPEPAPGEEPASA